MRSADEVATPVDEPAEHPVHDRRRLLSASLLGSTAALAGCGGEDSTGSPTPAPAPTPSATPTPTISAAEYEASRFLAQATNGASRSDIDHLVSIGIDSWLAEQMAMPRGTSHWSRVVKGGFNTKFKMADDQACDNSMWRQLITAPDQLRQRVGLALLDLLVVGAGGLVIEWPQHAMARYVDILLDHAFGNFRDLLGAISRNVAMAHFLTFFRNERSRGSGSQPDENYARELMQLFTIGLYELNQDGSVKLGADGRPIETYSQTDVSQLARVFTGLDYATVDRTNPDSYRLPLSIVEYHNEPGSSTFLGHTVGGGGFKAIDAALDVIFAHNNVAPFVSRNLIQRLTTSNPSPGYIARVAKVFANNGAGRRGDLSAVVRAILTDSEARDKPAFGKVVGKVRDPVQRFTNWARAFGAKSPSDKWAIGDLSDGAKTLGQSPGRSPSVFNFFRPGYSPPNSEISDRDLVAPELQIADEQSVIGYVNFMADVVQNGIGDVQADYSDFEKFADDSVRLGNEINLILAAGQLSAETLSALCLAVDRISLQSAEGRQKRVMAAAILTLASPDYIAIQ